MTRSTKAIEPYTSKQKGDAAVMLVAAELTLTGSVPAFPVPAGWPGYDIAADPAGRPLQRVQVKSSTFSKTRYIE